MATLYQPPFVQPILLPPSPAITYVRAVAFLEGGASTEDLAFVNAPEFSAEVKVDLVELYTTVVDRRGRPADGLAREEFTVLEDGAEQEIVRFDRVRDLPVHAGVLIDTSSSMLEILPSATRAALTFFRDVITPKDRAAVITFAERPQLTAPFSSHHDVLAGGLAAASAEGETALWDAVVFAVHYFSGLRGKRAIVLLSDGVDTRSKYDFDEALEFARRSSVSFYIIALNTPQREIDARSKVQRLAAETGGRVFFLDRAAGMERIYSEIEEELRTQYLLAYQSAQAPDRGGGKYRTIEVKVARPGLEARTIRGYLP
jgi:VWFA-related protein